MTYEKEKDEQKTKNTKKEKNNTTHDVSGYNTTFYYLSFHEMLIERKERQYIRCFWTNFSFC